jgi:hypothetical protein
MYFHDPVGFTSVVVRLMAIGGMSLPVRSGSVMSDM